jgi:HEAT repeat protein
VERLLSDLSAARPERRAVAMRLLTVVRDASVVDAVAQRLSDPDPSLRAAAADLLGELGDRSAIEPLRIAFGSDPDMEVVAAIERAYRRLADNG